MISEYPLPAGGSAPNSIVTGADGNLWFTEGGASYIGKITPSGTITQYPTPHTGSAGIAAGSDGNIWFAEGSADEIASVNPTTATNNPTTDEVTQYPVPAGQAPSQMTAAPGYVWFVERSNATVVSFNLASHAFTPYATPTAGSAPDSIVASSTGAIWFTEHNVGQVARLRPATGEIFEYRIPTASSSPYGIAQGADGNVYYSEGGSTANKIGVVTAPTCTTRQYTYDADSNRLTERTYLPATNGTCSTAGAPITVSHTYDAADRLTDSGVAYDAFGDITSLPAAAAGGSNLTSSYYTDGTLNSVTQAGQTITYSLDPTGRTRQEITSGTSSLTLTDHFDDGSDSPAWSVDGSGNWTRYISDIAGSLVATQTNGGTPVLQLKNLQGDMVATAPVNSTATTLSSQSDSTEFGVPREEFPARYAWHGSDERATALPSGVIAMGARTYVPQLGRFLQPDPVPGGSANSYDYANQDPVNGSDPTGDWALQGYVGEVVTDTGGGLSPGAFQAAPDVPSPTPETTPTGDWSGTGGLGDGGGDGMGSIARVHTWTIDLPDVFPETAAGWAGFLQGMAAGANQTANPAPWWVQWLAKFGVAMDVQSFASDLSLAAAQAASSFELVSVEVSANWQVEGRRLVGFFSWHIETVPIL